MFEVRVLLTGEDHDGSTGGCDLRYILDAQDMNWIGPECDSWKVNIPVPNSCAPLSGGPFLPLVFIPFLSFPIRLF